MTYTEADESSMFPGRGEAVLPEAPALRVITSSAGVSGHPSVATSTAVGMLAPVAELQRREQINRWLLALTDAAAATFATYVATRVWAVGEHWPLLLVPFYAVLVCKIQGLYDRDDMVLRKSTVTEWRRLLQAAVLTSGGVYVAWHTVTDSDKYRHLSLLLLVAGITFLASLVGRTGARRLARHLTAPERCLIVGEPDECEDLAQRLSELPGIEPISIVQPNDADWSETELANVVQDLNVHRIVVGPYSSWREPSMLELIRSAKWLGVRVSLMPSVMTVVGVSTAVDSLDSTVLLGVPRFGLSRSSLAIKRTFDLLVALGSLIVLAPLWLLVAIAIKLDTAGPVLFRQTRVGRDGRRFTMLKFRSMVDGADAMKPDLERLNEAGAGFFKLTDDPRTTRVGRVLRRTYVDELPQLINVVRGEMSLVGPRPLVEAEDALLTGFDRHRLRLAPGVTGPWQLRGPMHAPLEEMVKMDYMYASHWSVWTDLDVLLGTAAHVLWRRGN